MLEQAINDYLLWMISKGYAQSTFDKVEKSLKHFSSFVNNRKIPWKAIFTLDTLETFQKHTPPTYIRAVRGLARFVFQQKMISRPIQKQLRLPQVYKEYLLYYERVHQVGYSMISSARRVLSALDNYQKKRFIPLPNIKIAHLDAFLAEHTASFTPATCRHYRCALRGCLKYLYQEKKIKKNLAPLLVGAPLFTQAKPPKFLRPYEVQKLFDSLDTSSAKSLRTYAIVYLAYTLGLRLKEISLIRLDDISFADRALILRDRKAKNPIRLPLPEDTIKTIAAYIIGARPKSSERCLFLGHRPPHAPLSAGVIRKDITSAMKKANITGSASWLRHTHAQSLLESGASIFEIKQMLGHESIQSTKKYICIHTKLMRETIFDETL